MSRVLNLGDIDIVVTGVGSSKTMEVINNITSNVIKHIEFEYVSAITRTATNITIWFDAREVYTTIYDDKIKYFFREYLDLPKSNYDMVKEFTEQSRGILAPISPTVMSKDEVRFVIRMVLSEMAELALTVNDSPADAVSFMHSCLQDIDNPKPIQFPENEERDTVIIAEQMDAMVDAYYYMLDSAVKKGQNITPIFNEAHAANMRKRDPVTGKFNIRESDGKIIKSEGWVGPDMITVVKNMLA